MDAQPPRVSKKIFWAGWILSILPALLLRFSASMKFAKPPELKEGFDHLGYDVQRHAVALGVLEVVCTVVYLVPQTAVLGAILLTGYLGGATATHYRVGDPFVAPVIVGVLVWLGVFLRDARLRVLLPFRSLR